MCVFLSGALQLFPPEGKVAKSRTTHTQHDPQTPSKVRRIFSFLVCFCVPDCFCVSLPESKAKSNSFLLMLGALIHSLHTAILSTKTTKTWSNPSPAVFFQGSTINRSSVSPTPLHSIRFSRSDRVFLNDKGVSFKGCILLQV